ncbi:MAG: DUF2007 domain-containing protein [Armatimonadota bacterium]
MDYLYCPICLTEYEPHAKECRECQTALVTKDKLIVEKKQVEGRVSVFRADSEVQALAIVSLLEEQEIEAVAASKQVPMYDGIFQTDMGYWGEVLVPKSDYEKSVGIIKGYMKE